jgi:hypothetical protein
MWPFADPLPVSLAGTQLDGIPQSFLLASVALFGTFHVVAQLLEDLPDDTHLH